MTMLLQHAIRIHWSCILLFVSFHQLSAQFVNAEFFRDSSATWFSKAHDVIPVEDGFIVAGSMGGFYDEYPVIVKIDTLAELKWSTFPANEIYYGRIQQFNISLLEDGFIYGNSTRINGSQRPRHLWKVDPSTGEVVWFRSFYSDGMTNSSEIKLSDLNDTTFVGIYIPWGTSQAHLAVFDRNSGDTVRTDVIEHDGSVTDKYDITRDGNGNVFVSTSNRLTKLNRASTGQVIWSRRLNEHPWEMVAIDAMHMDEQDQLFLFGSNHSGNHAGMVYRVDIHDGTVTWGYRYHNSLAWVDLGGYRVGMDKIHVTYIHNTVGSGSKRFWTFQINKEDGNTDWSSEELWPGTVNNSEQGALDLDVDCEGDIYLTGYTRIPGEPDFRWASMKLQGSDGMKIWESSILGGQGFGRNQGEYVSRIGQGMFEVGQIALNGGPNRARLQRLDPGTGTSLLFEGFGGAFQRNSDVISLVPSNNPSYSYMLRQEGQKVVLSKRLLSAPPLFEETIAREGYMRAGQVKVSSGFPERVFVSTEHLGLEELSPYAPLGTDAIYVHQYLATGVLERIDSILFDPVQMQLVELAASRDSVYLFYARNDSLLFRARQGGNFSVEGYLGAAGERMAHGGNKNLVLNRANELLVLGTSGILRIQKSDLTVSMVHPFGADRGLHDLELNGASLFMCGSDDSNDQVVRAVDLGTMSLLWEESYGQDGALVRLAKDNYGNLYAAGHSDSTITVTAIRQTDGVEEWSFVEPTSLYPRSIAYDLAYSPLTDHLFMTGTLFRPDEGSDILDRAIGIWGDTVLTHVMSGIPRSSNLGRTVMVMPNSEVFSGGSIHRMDEYAVEGVLKLFELTNVPTGLPSVPETPDWHIYPNPVMNTLFISGEEGPVTIEVFDLTGRRCILVNSTGDTNIDVQNLMPGAYLLAIRGGHDSAIFRFIKE